MTHPIALPPTDPTPPTPPAGAALPLPRPVVNRGQGARIIVAHRRAQVRVALREQRELQRRHEQERRWTLAHPEALTIEGQRALFAGPIVERGLSNWVTPSQRPEAA